MKKKLTSVRNKIFSKSTYKPMTRMFTFRVSKHQSALNSGDSPGSHPQQQHQQPPLVGSSHNVMSTTQSDERKSAGICDAEQSPEPVLTSSAAESSIGHGVVPAPAGQPQQEGVDEFTRDFALSCGGAAENNHQQQADDLINQANTSSTVSDATSADVVFGGGVGDDDFIDPEKVTVIKETSPELSAVNTDDDIAGVDHGVSRFSESACSDMMTTAPADTPAKMTVKDNVDVDQQNHDDESGGVILETRVDDATAPDTPAKAAEFQG